MSEYICDELFLRYIIIQCHDSKSTQMGVLTKILLVILVISSFTFIALFGRLPAFRRTPIGFLARLFCDYIPRWLYRFDYRLFGGRNTRTLRSLANYLFFKRNPLVLLIFLTILTGSSFMFLRAAYTQLSALQLFPVPFVLLAPYLFTYLCATTRSMYITPANHDDRLHDYPYDHILYRPNAVCKTCHLTKPARSKHCSLCGHCVAKCDHHCPWVNNCLGKDNYHYFLALLLSLGVLEIYGANLAWSIIRPRINWNFNTLGLTWFHIIYWKKLTAVIVDAAHRGGLSITGVGMLAATTAPLPLGLLAYHIYLIWAGMTTNENQKWSYWREDMADGTVFRARRSDVLAHNELMRNQISSNQLEGGHLQKRVSYLNDEEEQEEPDVDWPVSSDQMIVRTNDGRPPIGREYLYERVWDLTQVENIYDLGFVDNLRDVFQAR